jgi:hypothetical protein
VIGVIGVAEVEEVQVVREALVARVKAEGEVHHPTSLHKIVDPTAVADTAAQEANSGAMAVAEDLVGVVEVTRVQAVETCERV